MLSKTTQSPGEKIVREMKRATREQYSFEEKIRIMLDGLRGEDSLAELCRREGISQGIFHGSGQEAVGGGYGTRSQSMTRNMARGIGF